VPGWVVGHRQPFSNAGGIQRRKQQGFLQLHLNLQAGEQDISEKLERGAATDVAALPKLRVLIIGINYAPELVGCAKYTTELAEDLVARGHIVEVIAGPPYYPSWRVGDGYSGRRWSKETRAGVVVHRTPLYVPAEPRGVRRLLHLASFGAGAFPTAIGVARRFRPHLVFAIEPTLVGSIAALASARISGAKSWLHVQDFEVDAAFELGLLTGTFARRMAVRTEARVMRSFDRVSAISTAMVGRLINKGIASSQVSEFRNWVDIDSVPVFPSTNTNYRASLDIPSHHVVALYSGNMAAKQGLDMVAEVARQLATQNAPVTLILCGDGPGRVPLEAACDGLSNVRFLPLQPLERLPELLGTADIHLLPQRPEAADLLLPSKLTGILASARPVVAMALPGTGLAEEVDACGIAVQPTATAMTEALLRLAKDVELRRRLGSAARARAETRWNKRKIIDSFESDVFALTRTPSRSA
jgi:colanic acid biosynthesis glycosyl transferase WcaI